LPIAPSAAGRFRLHNIAARAYAVAGYSGGIGQALRLADVERDAMDGTDEIHDGIGGEFTFEGARASACAAAAWLANRKRRAGRDLPPTHARPLRHPARPRRRPRTGGRQAA
jgi:hypothetical protein